MNNWEYGNEGELVAEQLEREQPGKGMNIDRDEFAYHTPAAKEGILFIRAMTDKDVLEACIKQSAAWRTVFELLGPNTNHSWITSQAAEEAYRRGLIDEQHFDWLVR